MNSPLISIIVPAYNTAPYLESSINSLLSQTYPNLEIILVDDGSTDGSSAICDELASRYRNIKVLHQKNHGIYLSRLNGVKLAAGDFIGFSDSDDFAEPDLYQILHENISKEHADISHCGYAMLENDRQTSYYGTGRYLIQTRKEGVRDLLAGVFIEPTLCTKLYRRSLFDYPFISDRIDFSEDLLLNFQLFTRAQKSVYEDRVLYKYIRRSNSICRKHDIAHEMGDIDRLAELLDRLSAGKDEFRQYVENKILAKKISLYKMLITEHPEMCKSYRRTLPLDMHSTDFRTALQVFLIRHFPNFYHFLVKKMRG